MSQHIRIYTFVLCKNDFVKRLRPPWAFFLPLNYLSRQIPQADGTFDAELQYTAVCLSYSTYRQILPRPFSSAWSLSHESSSFLEDDGVNVIVRTAVCVWCVIDCCRFVLWENLNNMSSDEYRWKFTESPTYIYKIVCICHRNEDDQHQLTADLTC